MTALPPPRFVVHVGVTSIGDTLGNDEQLAQAARRIMAAIAEISADLRSQAGEIFQSGPPLFRCISSLAGEGERLFARQALACAWELQAVIPSQRSEKHDPIERDHVAAIEAAAKPPVAAPGEGANDPTWLDHGLGDLLAQAGVVLELDGDCKRPESARLATEQIVLDHSDILVVIAADEEACAATPLAELAIARGLPVIVIGINESCTIRMLGRFGSAESWDERLPQILADILLPAGIKARHEQWLALVSRKLGRSMALLAHLHRPILGLFLVGWRSPPIQQGPEVTSPPPANALLDAHFARADAAAVEKGNIYRSAAALRYLLILPATLAALVGFNFPSPIRELGFATQAGIIGLVLLLGWLDRRHCWHATFVDLRFLAELLRHQKVLGLLGRVVPAAVAPAHRKGDQAQWANWYLRAIIRDIGLRSAVFDAGEAAALSAVLAGILSEQGQFYQARGQRFEVLSRRLGRLGQGLFKAGMVMIVVRAVFFPFTPAEWVDVRQWIGLACMILPTLSPVFMGMSSQGEYDRLARHYAAMSEHLAVLMGHLETGSKSHARLTALAMAAVEIMLSEVADWRTITKARPIPK